MCPVQHTHGGIGHSAIMQSAHIRRDPVCLQLTGLPVKIKGFPAIRADGGQLLFQPVPHLGVGHIFLAGGNESGDAPFQLCVTVHRQCALPDKSAALKDFPGDT